MNDLQTSLPGKIISYDGSFAVVRPALAKQLANGETLAAPIITNVPIHWPTGMNGEAIISVPLKGGDDVTLFFASRSIENWLSGADGAPPDDPRQFDLSDCYATPICRPGVAQADTVNVAVVYGQASMRIGPDGIITFTGTLAQFNVPVVWTQGMTGSGTDGSGGTGTIVIQGNVDFQGGTVTHNGKNIGDTHKHHENGAGNLTDGPQ
jgi:hypothetical protein